MTHGGSEGGDALLIGPFLDWWERRSAKRDAKRSAKAEAKAMRQAAPTSSSRDDNAAPLSP